MRNYCHEQKAFLLTWSLRRGPFCVMKTSPLFSYILKGLCGKERRIGKKEEKETG